MMDKLIELAARCEAATGPDRELDVEIAVAVDWRWPDWEEGESTARGQAEKRGLAWLVDCTCRGMASMWRHIPSYTGSLDAAMTLVPEGWGFAIGEYVTPRRRPFARTFPPDFANSPLEHQESDNCATAALALCAAALRARSAGVTA